MAWEPYSVEMPAHVDRDSNDASDPEIAKPKDFQKQSRGYLTGNLGGPRGDLDRTGTTGEKKPKHSPNQTCGTYREEYIAPILTIRANQQEHDYRRQDCPDGHAAVENSV